MSTNTTHPGYPGMALGRQPATQLSRQMYGADVPGTTVLSTDQKRASYFAMFQEIGIFYSEVVDLKSHLWSGHTSTLGSVKACRRVLRPPSFQLRNTVP